MPSNSKFIRYAYTITTSSAAAERVFSVIKRSFDTNQKGALEDYVFLSATMQYNRVVNNNLALEHLKIKIKSILYHF